MNLAKTARNAAVADLAIAFARDRLAAQLPGVKPRKRRPPGKGTVRLHSVGFLEQAYAQLRKDGALSRHTRGSQVACAITRVTTVQQ